MCVKKESYSIAFQFGAGLLARVLVLLESVGPGGLEGAPVVLLALELVLSGVLGQVKLVVVVRPVSNVVATLKHMQFIYITSKARLVIYRNL